MSALSFLNLLLSILHLAALVTCVVCYGILITALIRRLARKTREWPYPKIEVCAKSLGLGAMAIWLTALPSILFIASPMTRHFSVFGLVNLELFLISGGALLYVINKAQERYPGREPLISRMADSMVFRLAIACLVSSILMIVFGLAPDRFLPSGFLHLPTDRFSLDLLAVLILLTVLIFVSILPVSDEWINYRFSRGRNADGARLTDSKTNLLRGVKS